MSTTTDTQALYCKLGDHIWHRPVKRGVRPENCPQHKPVVKVVKGKSDKQQVLTCAEGNHTWERPSQKGNRPKYCPEHQPTVQIRTDNGESITVAKNIKHSLASLQERFHIPIEAQYKLEYIEAQLKNGTRTSGDADALLKRQREVIREVERQNRHVAPVLDNDDLRDHN